ncbi:MAG: ABC transporter permease subunit [Candidatus Sericytochromatia bacterium]
MLNNKLFKYVLFDVLRSKVLISYALLLFGLGYSISSLSADSGQIAISLLNLVLLLVPLVSVIFSTSYLYNLGDFLDLLLAQPVSRKEVFLGQYLGLASALAIGFAVGLGIPILLAGLTESLLWLLIVGVILSFVFTGLGFFAVTWQSDRVRGMAVSLLVWFYMAILFDALVLLGLVAFQDYPLETPTLVLSFLNPVDLARILILLKLDISALMGYTGALYSSLFGSWWGLGLALGALGVWIAAPILLALKLFQRKDC